MDTDNIKIIANFPNYTINKDGEVRNIKLGNILTPREIKYGYIAVDLYSDNINKHGRTIHRLLFEAFKLNDGELMPRVVDHINGITNDNSLANLRGATHKQNQMNSKTSKNNKLGLKNISLTKYGTYLVRINLGSGITYYKSHTKVEDAIKDAERVRLEHRGDFANNG